MTQTIGEIRLISYTDIPSGWLRCRGQSLSINEYPKLYMLLGAKFGRESELQFNLPNLTSNGPEDLVYCIATVGELPNINGKSEEGWQCQWNNHYSGRKRD
ncbi:MAG: phage tail protein [Clostridiales bacterium]|nr:phage tail protein [Clostridiales bacterium]